MEYANAILSVPESYPLKKGIAESFRESFKALVEFAKAMYLDIAKAPEKYGIPLFDVNDPHNGVKSLMGQGLIHHKSWASLHRAMDVLYALSYAGEMEGDVLKADARLFASKVKEMKLAGYASLFDGLEGINFVFAGYAQGKIKDDFITVSFPSNPKIIKALKTYCDCRNIDESQRPYVKGNLDFYAFDYKFTSDLSALPEINWVKDKIFTWTPEAKEFYMSFYRYITKNLKVVYKSVDPHSDFYINGQMAAKLRYEDDYWRHEIGCFTNSEYKEIMTRGKRSFFVLILYLRIKDDKHKDRFDNLSTPLIEYMKSQKCQDCNAFEKHKTKSAGRCPYTVIWIHEGVEYKSCAFGCFHFENPRLEDIPAFCELLAAEYERPGIKNINRCHVRA